MGYNTKFQGELKFTTPITGPDIAFLKSILGEDCRDHPEWGTTYDKMHVYRYEKNYSSLTYINLDLTDDFNGLRWNETEKTYDLVDKANLVIALMQERVPEFGVTGVLSAQGEEFDDRWELFIDDDGWAHRRDLVLEGEVQECPHCHNRFIPGEEIDEDYHY